MLGVLALQVPGLLYPWGEDPGLYAALGDAMGRGVQPYRDVFFIKPPGVAALAWIQVTLLGTAALAGRLFELAFVLLAAGSCAGITAGLGRPRDAWLAALTCGVLLSPALRDLQAMGMVEVPQGALLAAAMWATLVALEAPPEAPLPRRPLVLAGAAWGAACWLKPQGALLGPVLLGLLGARRGRAGLGAGAGHLALGALLPSAPLLAWILVAGLGPGLAASMALIPGYLSMAPSNPWWMTALHAFPGDTPDRVVLAALALVGLGLGRAARDAAREPAGRLADLTLLAWFAVGWVQFTSGAYHFPYHAQVAVPAAACLVARGLSGAPPALGLAALVLLGATAPMGEGLLEAGRVLTGARPLEAAQLARGRTPDGSYDYRLHRDLGRWLAAHTGPGEPIQVLGRAGVVYLTAGRPTTTPTWSLTGQALSPWWPGGEALRRSFLDPLMACPPRLLVVRTDDPAPYFHMESSAVLLRQDPVLGPFVEARYAPAARFGGAFVVLRRRAEAPREGCPPEGAAALP